MLEVGRAEVHALDALLAADGAEDVQIDVYLGSDDPDEVECAARAQHGETLLGYRLQPYEVEDVIGSSWQKIPHRFNRLRFCGIDDVGGTESSCRVQPLRLDVDGDYPRGASDARAADCIKPDASGPDDHNRIAGAHIGGVQDRA